MCVDNERHKKSMERKERELEKGFRTLHIRTKLLQRESNKQKKINDDGDIIYITYPKSLDEPINIIHV